MGSGLDDTIPASSPPGEDEEVSSPTGERYRLGAELGRGGMGRVVEAFDTQLGRTVAFKEVLPNAASGLARRFRREVEITARLEHPSIVPLYDAGRTEDGRPFYVMRRVTGRPLEELIARTRTLDERLALLPNVLAAIDGIAHAHKRGVIHRDLKPGNILVGELGETVVIDWGLAKVVGEADSQSGQPTVPSAADSLQTQMGSVFGTPGFMAPEQARGEELDTSGDVFALGATLYHVLAGRPPVKGKSATEVIEGTLTHKIPPLVGLVPGVPAELVAIVDKALAFDRKQRYADAGELGEDLRRFTTGQLVAAHDYTALQRLRRFIRRNRAPLSVAAAMTTALAALAWIGVHSVMRERDIASSERTKAVQQSQLAQKRADELAHQADELRLLHARTLIDSNPTQAIAVLKDLSASSTALADAQAIAKAAVMRGVAWGVPALPGFTIALQLSHDGRRLLQVTRDGALQIVDLDARRAVVTHNFGQPITAGWVAGDTRIFVSPDHHAPLLYDPATGHETPLDAGACKEWAASDDGSLVAYITEEGSVRAVSLPSGAIRELYTGKPGSELAVAADGSWIAFDDAGLLVIDRDGKQLLRRPGRVAAPTSSPDGKLAVISDSNVVETRPLDKAPAWVTVPLSRQQALGVHYLVYTAGTLDMFAMDALLSWNGKVVWTADHLRDGVLFGRPAGDGLMVVSTSDGKLHVVGDGVTADLAAPSLPENLVRIAARPGLTRFAATCRDALCVWDADTVIPKQLPFHTPGFFVDDHKVVINENLPDEWKWLDLDTGKTSKLASGPVGIPERVQVAPDGRLALLVNTGKPTSTLAVYSADLAKVHVLAGVSSGRLVDGDGVVALAPKSRIVGELGDAPPRDVLKLDGEVIGLFEAGPQQFVALTSLGEVVRCKLDGNDLVRTHIPIEPGAFVVADRQGRAVIANGTHLVRWDHDVHQIAGFLRPIESVAVLEGGLVVTLEGGEMDYVAEGAAPRRIPLPAGRTSELAEHGQMVVGETGGQITVVELPSLATWSLPRVYAGFDQYAVSPDGHRLLQATGAGVEQWELPQPGADWSAWLDELTNATEADGILTWPWQTRGP
jgi:hypothetical protein